MKKSTAPVDIFDNTKATISTSRWFTLEYLFYFGMILSTFTIVFYKGVQMSQSYQPYYAEYKDLLSNGWMFGKKMDNSEVQFAGFRKSIPFLTILYAAYVILGRLFRSTLADRFNNIYFLRFIFDVPFIIIMMLICHGLRCIFIAIIILINYAIAKKFRSHWINPILTWIFNITILFLNDAYQGYSFAAIHPYLTYLDRYQGLKVDWYVLFNVTTLRMISFNIDYYWCFHPETVKTRLQRHRARCDQCLNDLEETTCYNFLMEMPRSKEEFNIISYIAYLLYPPCFFAGPIFTFNTFMNQIQMSQKKTLLPMKSIIIYGFRLLFIMLLMELSIHFMYINAINKNKAWTSLSPVELFTLGYLLLKLIWLKLLIIWRFFRFWAIADGLNPIENMNRCMSNNYSGLGFWRSWHRSFNRWLIRYVYVPLGGKKYQFFNIWIVFTFVAVWHDISLNLLAWGWLISLFVLPEVACHFIFRREKFTKLKYYRHLCAFGYMLNVFMMITANLCGFAIGIDGLRDLLRRLLSWHGLFEAIFASVFVFSSVQIMFEIRSEEKRRSIKSNRD